MRRSLVAAAVGVAVLAVAPLAAAASATSTSSRTQQTTVRPVTASGRAAGSAGTYIVHHYGRQYGVDCSPAEASPAAVDDDIIYCGPSAADAIACWRAAQAHHVYCLTQADRKHLNEFTVSGGIGHAKAPTHAAPLNLKLANGDFCTLRDGGAGATLRQHRSWSTSFYCDHGQAVWTAHGFGVNRDHPVWTVELANADGTQHVHKVRVTRAWFVGTAR